jgi:hypothetical protein
MEPALPLSIWMIENAVRNDQSRVPQSRHLASCKAKLRSREGIGRPQITQQVRGRAGIETQVSVSAALNRKPRQTWEKSLCPVVSPWLGPEQGQLCLPIVATVAVACRRGQARLIVLSTFTELCH